MNYLVLCFGVYTGLYMRKFDEDRMAVRTIVQNARSLKRNLGMSFNRVIRKKKEDMTINTESDKINKVSKTIGETFDKLSESMLIDGLYKNLNDLKDSITGDK